jgi:DNA polymerase V
MAFPSPARDYTDPTLNLNDYLIQHPAATFYLRVSNHAMRGKGIFPGDLLIVDRALTAHSGSLVIATLNNEFLLREYQITNRGHFLRSAHPNFPSLALQSSDDFAIWGVVSHTIHAFIASALLQQLPELQEGVLP